MPRSIWNGAITIYATAIPVKLFAATKEQRAHFRELHEKDGAPIEHRKVSAKTGREVPKERIVKGYETSAGRHVVLAPEEIRAVEQPERKEIAIEHFVPAEQIDPVFFDRAYYLGAQDDGRDAFAALLRALERTERVGIGRFVLRAKEQLVALRPGDGVLRLSTMRFADELVDPPSVDTPKRAPSKREIEMAEKLVSGLEASFDPSAYRDSFTRRVTAYAKKKAAGKAPELAPVEEPSAPDDLLAALEASLKS